MSAKGSIVSILAFVLISAPSPGPKLYANAVAHQVIQQRPIKLGTSGGNLKDRNRRTTYCCSGTLGALVTDGNGTYYILGNNHVLARLNHGIRGQIITQPGLIDADCALGPSNRVARFTACIQLRAGAQRNFVDAALAQITSTNDVDVTGEILEIGQPSTETVVPALGSLVMKSGRTTGLTTGTVTAIDATLGVAEARCNRRAHVRTFVKQIIVTPNNFGNFAQGGDSGSLVVEATNPCPRVVGLLFAGSSTATAVNPIDEVLSALSAKLKKRLSGSFLSIVGCAPDELADVRTPLVAAESSGAAAFGLEISSLNAAEAAKSRHERQLLDVPGVVGIGVGRQKDDPTQATVEILVEKDSTGLRSSLPTSIDGVPCHVIETGSFVAF
ncbi:MAG TPA: hypothetical protein VL171_01825 [Verrucomicrobiae bacterium]|nr:hypothetical protein [Verrucomicrobiae bacterium]